MSKEELISLLKDNYGLSYKDIDLYENEYVRKSTIEYINNCFKQIPNTKIYITPGNHDPYISNSYYNKYEWNENVHIFTSLDRKVGELVDIYGYGFTNFYSKKIDIPKGISIFYGGQGWIRTTVLSREQIYSLPPLATRPPTHISLL